MLSPTLRLLLLAALMLPACLSAEDCHCRVTMKMVGYLHVPDYSAACYEPASACGITVDASGPVSFYGFTDLRGDTVVIKAYNLPLFLSSTLVDKRTHFIVETDGEAYSALPDAPLAVALLGILERGVDDYNDLLRDCPGTCTIGSPDISSKQPVSLASWSTEGRAGMAHLSWKTSEERDNAYFLLSHSTDGKTFRTLGTMGGRGAADTEASYTYRHAPAITGLHYYRLVQYAQDGTPTELGVQAITINPVPAPLSTPLVLPPVAAGQRIRIPSAFPQAADVGIYYESGEEAARVSLKHSTLHVPALPPGNYTLRIDGESSRLVVAR